MSRCLNQAMLIGNLGADPEVRTTTGGGRLARFSVATHRPEAVAGGWSERTDWHRVSAWDGLAEVAERSLRRGDRVYVAGRLEYRTWNDRAGRMRHAAEIVAEDLMPLTTPAPSSWREVLQDAPSVSPAEREDELPF